MDFQEFLRKQEDVYGKFRDTSKVESEGLVPNIPIFQGGYLIVCRHNEDISEMVENFSRRISRCVPSLVYDQHTVHTTLADFMLSSDFKPERRILDGLCAAVQKIPKKEFSVTYPSTWLYNQNSIIAPGLPEEEFLRIVDDINKSAKEEGMTLRAPWGAHITTNRFTERRSPEELKELFELMKESPIIGQSRLKYIDIGYFHLSPEEFKIFVEERFSLK